MHMDQSPEVAIAILGKHKPKLGDGEEKATDDAESSVDPALETHAADFLAAKSDAAKAAAALHAFFERCCVLREQEEGPPSGRTFPPSDDDDEDD